MRRAHARLYVCTEAVKEEHRIEAPFTMLIDIRRLAWPGWSLVIAT